MARRYSMIASLTLFSAKCFSRLAKASRAVAWGSLLHATRAVRSRTRTDRDVRLFILYLSHNPLGLYRGADGAVVRHRVNVGLLVELRQMNSAGITLSGDAGTGLTRSAMCAITRTYVGRGMPRANPCRSASWSPVLERRCSSGPPRQPVRSGPGESRCSRR